MIHSMHFIRIALLVSTLIGFMYGCKSKKIEETNLQKQVVDESVAQSDLIVAQIKRDACYGTCPVDLITIYNDGRVQYKGVKFVKNLGTHTANIDEERLLKLKSVVDDLMSSKLNKQYIMEHVSDLPSRLLTKPDGTTIRYQLNESPDILIELDKQVYEIKEAVGWSETVTH